MKDIKIAESIVRRRHEKGITQEDLAACMGVTKASVSKWETGLSYPDILILPKLAAFFNITIDELFDYTPQMTSEDIVRLYGKLADAFATKPFSEVKQECEQIIQKYYSCFPLLLKMAILYINHHMLSENPEEASKMLSEAQVLCERIRKEAEDMMLLKEAACMEAFIQLTLGNATVVFDLLGEEINCLMSPETLIIGAYKLQGNVEKARELSQVNIYLNLASIIDNLSAYLLLYQEYPDRGEDIIRRGCGLIDLFDLSKITPNSCAIFYYHAAATYINRSEKENAYLMLERYVSVCSEQLTHLSFHDDTFFDLLQGWADKGHLFDNLPRNQKVINEGILAALSQTPAFSQLGNEKRFKQLYRRLEQSLNKGV